jgi:DnaJ family protein B protein 4
MAQDFKRVGDDLLYTAKITLIQSLTGHTFDLRTLDGRLLHVPLDTVVHPK